ncbi:hypothetical protein LTR72_010057 [Exophiala xenobiotica]|nr:hypothetical protein LTR72_010057 [Exophiala xenobiotica]KAK5287724.1 hypothetical protein LTR14_008955 [Exophiala xenobiotica]KAK5475589.1 hypothetical protein LTR55_009218 [Exophiala xenobiotica]
MILPALEGRAERPPDTCLDLNSRSGALSSWHSAVDLDLNLKLRRFAFSTEATSEPRLTRSAPDIDVVRLVHSGRDIMISQRDRFLRHARRHLGLPSLTKHLLQDDDDGGEKLADPGDIKLYSSNPPALDADPVYTITAIQNITTPPPVEALPNTPSTVQPSLQNHTKQTFTVFAPQFSLESGDVHSTYPPAGHADLPNILPHIVFTNPHLPWERGRLYTDSSTTLSGDDKKRNQIPWLALLVFDGDAELKLTDAQRSTYDATKNPEGLFSTDLTKTGPVAQDRDTQAVPMTWQQLTAQTFPRQVATTDTGGKRPSDATTPLQVIFPPAALFTDLFGQYDSGGKLMPKPCLDRYRLLAHMRNINTLGMADAGVQDRGFFSIVISHRTGPVGLAAPKYVTVHLVSLDGIPENITLPISDKRNRVAMISLYSWQYRCLPPESVNFVDTMRDLAKQSQMMLRPSDTVLKAAKGLPNARPEVAKAVLDRLLGGYSLVRYRLQTGEETVAFNRGPLTPIKIDPSKFKGAGWPAQSNFSTDYQIFDPVTGIMDISYSTAWQLGRTLAIADQAFSTALTKYRSTIHTQAWSNAKARLLAQRGLWRSKADLLGNLSATITEINKLPHQHLVGSGKGSADLIRRWHRPDHAEAPDLSLDNEELFTLYKEEVAGVGKHLSSGKRIVQRDPSAEPETLIGPYNELNEPFSAQWTIILKWILDRMYLINVPAHYLITDPSHLPHESLRFFYIDPVWVDCLIDGALSVANHLDSTSQEVRSIIKKAVNDYLSQPIDLTRPDDEQLPTQVPNCGLLMRSALIEVLPDLNVSAAYRNTKDPRLDVLRHEIMDKGTMICMFDRDGEFSSDHLQNIVFAQPPHQQCFSLGIRLTSSELQFDFRKMYNDASKIPATDPFGRLPAPDAAMTWTRGDKSKPPVFNWDNNLVHIEQLGQDLLSLLNGNVVGFHDTVVGSAMLAMELNLPIYRLTLPPWGTNSKTSATVKRPLRQLYMGTTHYRKGLSASRRGNSYRPPPPHSNVKPVTISSVGSSKRPAPRWPRDPGPHIPVPRLPPSFDQAPALQDGQSWFRYEAFPSGLPNRGSFIPTVNKIPQVDFVIKIKQVPVPSPNDVMYLKRVQVEFPINNSSGQKVSAPAAANTPGTATLTDAYENTGATLLGNKRMLLSNKVDTTGKKLTVTLQAIPTVGFMPIGAAQDLSFQLSLIKVDASVGTMDLICTEFYRIVHTLDNGHVVTLERSVSRKIGIPKVAASPPKLK